MIPIFYPLQANILFIAQYLKSRTSAPQGGCPDPSKETLMKGTAYVGRSADVLRIKKTKGNHSK